MVYARRGLVPIEDIKENEEIGQVELRKVKQTFIREKNNLTLVHIENNIIETTEEHPFYIIGKGYIDAGDLKAGEKVLLESKEEKEITKVEKKPLNKAVKVYNFEVEGLHNFSVGYGVLKNFGEYVDNISKTVAVIQRTSDNELGFKIIICYPKLN